MVQIEREYAEALFSLAAEEQAAEEYLQSLQTVKQLMADNPDYVEFLNSPAIPLSERLSSVDEAFESSMPEYVVSFLKLLCENGKVRLLSGCIDEFVKLAMEFRTERLQMFILPLHSAMSRKQQFAKSLKS